MRLVTHRAWIAGGVFIYQADQVCLVLCPGQEKVLPTNEPIFYFAIVTSMEDETISAQLFCPLWQGSRSTDPDFLLFLS